MLADAFVDRLHQDVFGHRPGANQPATRGVEIQLVMSAEMLLGHDTTTPAHAPGHGPIPMPVVADLLASDELAVFVRRLFTHPDHDTVVAMDSHATFFRGGQGPPRLASPRPAPMARPHQVHITTPTGHTYDSHAPPLSITIHMGTDGPNAEAYLTDRPLVWAMDTPA